MSPTPPAAPATSSAPSVEVHRRARRVALGATAIAFVLYLAVAATGDLLVVDHLTATLDLRLAAQLRVLVARADTTGLPDTNARPDAAAGTALSDSGDIDDAPVVAWFIPKSGTRIVRLDAAAPALGSANERVGQPVNAVVGALRLRLEGVVVPSGRIVVGASTLEISTAEKELLLLEAALLPVLLGTAFGVATTIGRRAAAPIEEARLRQLDFTADASHELRTPLTVIEAEVGLALARERSPAAYRDSLERVALESKRLRTIVEDLLFLARLDDAAVDPEMARVDVTVAAQDAVRRFAPVADGRGIDLGLSSSPASAALVDAPSGWVDQLVAVLVDNACRYTPQGGHIEVSVGSAGERITFSVDDSGPGVDDAQRDRIFERFHRGSSAPGGAGLGLSIANAVVERTDGTWSVGRSVLGGAQFSVTWPAAPATEPVRRHRTVGPPRRHQDRRDEPMPDR